ncbi:hypothetical protein ASG22_18730 [Chryseobacterium sp. Leaf405]|uniref:hypothetical protein n=1 Tax=Chryseobacterium sp. Leaf405 TaxID=1736367 RepID=UPI0006FBF432|nr:hypothetical protein [Chryseobacterium sp. Leaf405]KQT31071.1 hypothetical protein ASG22_18730 [Chryseobacterium sp. Leaf405]
MKKTLLEITQTKNGNLSEVLVNWKNYDEEEVILSLSELKKRNVPINEQMENILSEFTQSKGKTISEIENGFFQSKGVKDYTEYYNSKINILEKSDEDKLHAERQRRNAIAMLEQMDKKQASKDVLYGGLWFAGGLIVTLVSLSSGSGGVIAYGAVIFGGIQFFRGIMKS